MTHGGKIPAPARETVCRLLLDPPGPGAWNMAVDEMLLERATAGGGCCWRFYAWEAPTLSLGYFQATEDRVRHPASQHCPMVRRPSGGGALVHDRELTYCFVAPVDHPLAARRHQLYATIHETLIEALAHFGMEARLVKEQAPLPSRSHPLPFLCFQRRAAGDVLLDQIKIAGSAQRRLRGAVLQHGSVLFERSAAAPELPGMAETKKSLSRETLTRVWQNVLAARFGWRWSVEPLAEDERQRARQGVREKYGRASWNLSRGRS